jgi:hypothetical protein
LLANGCGGSSTVNVVQPSTTKCEVSLANNVQTVPAAGGTGNLTVTTNRECSWSARAEAPWITLSTSEGQGSASLSYTVAGNSNGTPRQSAVVVGEQRVAVTQEAAPCRYEVSPSSLDVDPAGGEISVSLSSPGRVPLDRSRRRVLDQYREPLERGGPRHRETQHCARYRCCSDRCCGGGRCRSTRCSVGRH